jgi:glycosyltransferase involved in cell wall biosynthesis
LADRADLIVASTLSLKMELAEFLPGKPVFHVPDGIDYGGCMNPVPTPPAGPVVWFGNPGRGNFDSARGLLDMAKNELGRSVKLISRKRSFAADPDYRDLCVDWNPDTFVDELRDGGVCVVTHSQDEPLKSPNRLVTAVANGVPTIAYQSPACEQVLEDANCPEAILQSEAEFATALEKFSDPQFRTQYLRKAQDYVGAQFGPNRMRQRYERLFADSTWRKRPDAPLRAMFVSHNLHFGEGAPTSLCQTIVGLQQIWGIDPVVYSPLDGRLREKYEENGIAVWLSGNARRSRTLVGAVGNAYADELEDFAALLEQEQVDVLLCNTAKTLFYGRAAARLGIPAIGVIRESSEEHVNMTFAGGEMMADSVHMLRHGNGLVFVSEFTRQLWLERNDLAPTTVIPNGIHVEHWEALLHRPVADVRAALELDPHETVILCVGTITPRKGQADLVQAFAQLPEAERQNARVVLVGARPSRYLDELVSQLDALPPEVASRVTIVSETSDIGYWYRAADLFVLASYNESYPRVVVEAMFFGLPVIASAVFGAKEQVVDGVSGLLFEAGDIRRLSEHLSRLLGDTAFRRHMAERSQRRFWELCTFEEMVTRYAALLFNLTATRPRAKRHSRVNPLVAFTI